MPSNESRTTLDNNFAHIFGFVGYIFISEILFLFTTIGWSGFFYIIFGIPVYLAVLVILISRSFFSRIVFAAQDWKYLLITQGLLLVVNVGDCEAGGTSNFFQRAFEGFESCVNTHIHSPVINGWIFLIGIGVYIIFLLRLVFGLPASAIKSK